MIRCSLRAMAIALSFAIAPALLAQSEMRLDRERQSLTGIHRHFTQFLDGVPVVGGERSETLLPDGLLRINHERVAAAPAERHSARAATLAHDADAEFVYVNIGGVATPAWKRIESARPLEPHAKYYDAATGALLLDVPLYFSVTVKGRVFDVNPVAKLNAPWLRDANGSATAVPADAYSDVDFEVFSPFGLLSGFNAQIVDVQEPFTPHADVSQPLIFDRSQPQFAEVNAYFQIDRAQRYLQSLGYLGAKQIAAYSIPIDPHAANGTDNSYYLSGSMTGRGTLYFGDGGTPDAEDSDIMLHEYMHAVHDWIIPGALNGAISSQARAISEGLGDYWAFSSTYAMTTASGRDPYCIGDWDARCGGDDPSRQCGYPDGADCLRRVDSRKTIADYIESETPGTEHLNGEMWSSALREIFLALGGRYGAAEGKRVTDTIVIESLFGLPPDPGFSTVAQSMIAADRLLRGGAEIDVICGAMTSRGLLANCGNVPRGEWTLLAAPDKNVMIPDGSGSLTSTLNVTDSRTISSVAVRVDIAHPSRGDLVITLTSPAGTTVKLKEASPVDRTADVHASFGIDAAPAESLAAFAGQPANGTWTLTVKDIYTGDAGTLQSWDLRIAFAGDAAFAQRPSASANRVIVPVAGHAIGFGGSSFTSDVTILNRGVRDAHEVLVFTPTGADGTTTFAAARLTIPVAQTVTLRDVVTSVFAMSGTGAITIDSDSGDILVTSTAKNTTAYGELTQTIDTVTPAGAIARNSPPLELYPFVPNGGWRRNVGLVETSGAGGAARLVVHALTGETIASFDIKVPAYGHVQIPVPLPVSTPTLFGSVSVISGDAHLIAYVSMVENGSGDAMTVIGQPASTATRQMVVPVVASTPGIGGVWNSELWWANLTTAEDGIGDIPLMQMTFHPSAGGDAIHSLPGGSYGNYVANTLMTNFVQRNPATGWLELLVPPKTFAMTRTWTSFSNSSTVTVGEKIAPVDVSAAIGAGGSVDAAGIVQSQSKRTNFGITETSGAAADVRVSLIDAGGNLVTRTAISLGAAQHLQLPLKALSAAATEGARLRFEVVGGSGRIVAYASIVDSGRNDPWFILAR